MYGVFPEKTTWQVKTKGIPEEVWKYNIISIDVSYSTHIIKKFTLPVSSLEEAYHSEESKYLVAQHLVDGFETREIRSKDQFLREYNASIDHLNKIIGS
jgi:hypothetical protein